MSFRSNVLLRLEGLENRIRDLESKLEVYETRNHRSCDYCGAVYRATKMEQKDEYSQHIGKVRLYCCAACLPEVWPEFHRMRWAADPANAKKVKACMAGECAECEPEGPSEDDLNLPPKAPITRDER